MSQLVFKILKPAATFHGIDYNERKAKKDKAQRLYLANFGLIEPGDDNLSAKSLKKYMDWFCTTNNRIRNKQFHAILSCKGNMYSHEQLKSYGLEIMDCLGYDKTPMAIYAHKDTNNLHLHIVTTRVGVDGKKITHHFEGKRANEIVSRILHTDKKTEFSAETADALCYEFSTVAQFQLLMELKGYAVKKNETSLKFFKYGALQGSLSLKDVEQKLKYFIEGDKQMKAVIGKFKRQYSVLILESEKDRYTTEKKSFRTQLTDELYKKFGWQFVFFKSPGLDRPYGYVVIDHNKKRVHKGSNIVGLNYLLSTERSSKEEDKISRSALTSSFINQTDKVQGQEVYSKNDLITAIDELIKSTEFEADREAKKAHDAKKKKGRFI